MEDVEKKNESIAQKDATGGKGRRRGWQMSGKLSTYRVARESVRHFASLIAH